jgi:hypothetical protein
MAAFQKNGTAKQAKFHNLRCAFFIMSVVGIRADIIGRLGDFRFLPICCNSRLGDMKKQASTGSQINSSRFRWFRWRFLAFNAARASMGPNGEPMIFPAGEAALVIFSARDMILLCRSFASAHLLRSV